VDVAVRLFDVVPVIVNVPAVTAWTTPVATFTVATDGVFDVYDTEAPAITPPEPETTDDIVTSGPPTTIESPAGDMTMLVGVLLAATVTAHVAVLLFAVVAVMVAEPTATGVTTPDVSTVATLGVPELQVTGAASTDPAAFLTVAASVPVGPGKVIASVVGDIVTVDGVVSGLTVTLAVAVLPFPVVTVIVTEPAASAWHTPAGVVIVASAGLLDVNEIAAPGRTALSALVTVAVKVRSAPPTVTVPDAGLIVTAEGTVSAATATVVVSVSPFDVVAVKMPPPWSTACTTPELDPTVNTLGVSDVYVTLAPDTTPPAALVTTDVTFTSEPPTTALIVRGDITIAAGVVSVT
jgi:hypothetical protein